MFFFFALGNHLQSKDEEKFAAILEYLPYRKADWTFVSLFFILFK